MLLSLTFKETQFQTVYCIHIIEIPTNKEANPNNLNFRTEGNYPHWVDVGKS